MRILPDSLLVTSAISRESFKGLLTQQKMETDYISLQRMEIGLEEMSLLKGSCIVLDQQLIPYLR